MKLRCGFLLYAVFATNGAMAASFLKPASFPKTINDVSFNDRIKNEAAGYAPFKDASAYMRIQLQSVNDALADEIEQMEQEHELYCLTEGRDMPECQPYEPESQNQQNGQNQQQNQTQQNQNNQNNQENQNNQNSSSQQQQQQNQNTSSGAHESTQPITNGTPGTYCALKHPHLKPGQTQPLGVPVSPELDIYDKARNGSVCSSFGGARSSTWRHHGVDIGCNAKYYKSPVFAVADGVVRSVKKASACKSAGNMISITHADGFISYYMHLDSIYVTKGQKIKAGCQIGTMGYTGGNKTQQCPKMGKDLTHLHYELRNKSKPAAINTPKGKVSLKYVDQSFDPMPLMKL